MKQKLRWQTTWPDCSPVQADHAQVSPDFSSGEISKNVRSTRRLRGWRRRQRRRDGNTALPPPPAPAPSAVGLTCDISVFALVSSDDHHRLVRLKRLNRLAIDGQFTRGRVSSTMMPRRVHFFYHTSHFVAVIYNETVSGGSRPTHQEKTRLLAIRPVRTSTFSNIVDEVHAE